ncbi:glycerol-3-phosphate cytidylyltransferase [Photobacterium kishitanii]|uniref:adenylyltransferase/cytidyltransferase family protein n=1 Tax=Photobacterium kishitanii TaxID=318456 RepID=UPI000D175353|nr:adenylyltransferase/cytidyltransferase family protein [Photobacterium kishitanii]PSU85482.1 glycerol-3-phosphate cytidylyltransferase [Photobacterium kishitanii]
MKKNNIKVFTSGTWDLFHVGHLNIINQSSILGDELIVGVSTDELVEEYKGVKPIIPFKERFEIISSIKGVTKVVEQKVLTEIDMLKEFNIDIVTIGDDWKNKHLDGLEWMKKNGKRVEYFSYTDGVSTTSIKKDIIDNTYNIIRSQLSREISQMESWKKKQ